jgi:hypothetical protein
MIAAAEKAIEPAHARWRVPSVQHSKRDKEQVIRITVAP